MLSQATAVQVISTFVWLRLSDLAEDEQSDSNSGLINLYVSQGAEEKVGWLSSTERYAQAVCSGKQRVDRGEVRPGSLMEARQYHLPNQVNVSRWIILYHQHQDW